MNYDHTPSHLGRQAKSLLVAIASFLADGNEPRMSQIQAISSSLPHFSAPAEPNRAGTSLLVSLSGHGSSTGDLPGFSMGGSVRSGESITSFGVHGISERPHILEQEFLDGPLVLPQPLVVTEPLFECPFYFLGCYHSFSDESEWFNHSLTHFGNVGPPSLNECPLCERHYGQFTSSIPMESWRVRMMFISSHIRQGARIGTARPDFFLIGYLWQNDLISKAQYRNLVCRSESQAPAYTVTETRRSKQKHRQSQCTRKLIDRREPQ